LSDELARLKRLLDAERVQLGVHIRKMNSPGSPVYDAWENIWPVGSILTASFAATAIVHYYLGAVILAAGCGWWLMKVHPRIKDGVFGRTAALALRDEASFDGLFYKGLITLYAKLPDGEERVATRRDDWRAFVRAMPLGPGDVPAEAPEG
jgi:hypothetical protein